MNTLRYSLYAARGVALNLKLRDPHKTEQLRALL